MQGLVSQRLNEAAGPTFYPTAEITAALNEANRLFCLLTLGLERTIVWPVAASISFFHMLQVQLAGTNIFPDWIAPLRITNSSGGKLRPSRLADLWALDSGWPATVGTPSRYCHTGADLVAINAQFASLGSLTVTYARAPVALVYAGDVPEIPAEYHAMYVSYAIYRCRQAEGGQEFAKTLPLLEDFLGAADAYGKYIRSRNAGLGYDRQPFELSTFDRSLLTGVKQ